MSQQEIEVILARHLAEYLAMPIFIVEPNGDLLFYNEPAEKILGLRYDETGPMPAAEWATVFQPVNEEGIPLPTEELPLIMALSQQSRAHKMNWMRGLDGRMRQMDGTAIMLKVQANRCEGELAI